MLCKRYEEYSLLLYANFNQDLRDLDSEIVRMLERYEVKPQNDKNPDSYTCKTTWLGRDTTSYLDFVVTHNLEVTQFTLQVPVGNSDHRALSG